MAAAANLDRAKQHFQPFCCMELQNAAVGKRLIKFSVVASNSFEVTVNIVFQGGRCRHLGCLKMALYSLHLNVAIKTIAEEIS